jgi:hypothetical protein
MHAEAHGALVKRQTGTPQRPFEAFDARSGTMSQGVRQRTHLIVARTSSERLRRLLLACRFLHLPFCGEAAAILSSRSKRDNLVGRQCPLPQQIHAPLLHTVDKIF